mgnify:CR=1 FL=1
MPGECPVNLEFTYSSIESRTVMVRLFLTKKHSKRTAASLQIAVNV